MKKFFRSALSTIVLLPLFAAPGASASQKLSLAAQPASPPSLSDRRASLNALFAQYWDAYLEHNPEFASTIGDKRFNSKLSDFSVEARNAWLAQEQNFLLRLAAIGTDGFTDQEKLSRTLLMRRFTQEIKAADFKEWEMPVNQLGGIYSRYPELAAQLSFQSIQDYDDWIARLRALPHAFDQVTNNMALGIEDHRVPPKFLLEKTLPQVELLANEIPEDSPLAAPLKHFPASVPAADQDRIKAEMLDVIAKQDLPAYKRFARYTQVTYIPAGRTEPGIWSIPGGDQYYQFLIARQTTTDLTPAVIHQIGLEQVQKDEAAMLAIAQKLGFKDLKSFQDSVKSNPKLHPASAEALLDAYRSYLTPMQAKLPQLFGHLPRSPFEVVAVPPYLEKNAPTAYYQPGTADGSRPGRLNIDTYNFQDRNLCDVEAIAYHEGLPGHHLQISLQREMKGLPAFRRYQMYGAYTEGWALYAEQLGKDVGFYQDPYEDYGRLQNDIWRAIRLVVDTGVHSQHWTRQQMVDYFHAHSSIDETDVQAEVDRYIAWPAQALTYKIGQLTILALRDEAKKELGPRFDLRAFNDEILSAGSIPLDLLATRTEAWIATQKSGAK
ncbi:MAG TPA: DUF885 domain-containing protein [Terracidiphilus sp.]|nr:DUF885 domain-containing protein [Terracidiphilus sp.]